MRSDGRWQTVTKEHPCPACGHADWCALTPDGRMLKCERSADTPVGMVMVKHADGGALFKFADDAGGDGKARGQTRRRAGNTAASVGDRTGTDWATTTERFVKTLTDDRRTALAGELGVSSDALTAIGVGWATRDDLRALGASGQGWADSYPDGAYTFAERNGLGHIVGLSLRATDGRKGSPSRTKAGARRGLIISTTLAERGDPVLIVEGASDVAACETQGIAAVGRPSNSSGADDLAKMLRGREILVVGERDQKPDGRWPGRDGAATVAKRIAAAWREPVFWTLPPDGSKDIRSWLRGRITDGLNLTDTEACRQAGAALLDELRSAAKQAKPSKAPSQADLLVEIASDAELFHTPGGHDAEPYATVTNDGHAETWAVNSKGFRRWLARVYYQEHSKAPATQALQDALNVIAGRALFDGEEITVAVRLAEFEGAIWLDLADEQWRAVCITDDGWSVVTEHPVRFIRPRGMLALPEPVRDGDIDELRELVNVPGDDDWALLLSCLVAALRPIGPYPLLIVNGEQGSAKSTLCRMIRALIDPNKSLVRAEPREVRDLMIAASNGWFCVFDNLSRVPPWLSDALCRLSTGGGFATRELYTDGDEKIFDAQRPVILNGIEELATRADLADRAILLTLPTIDEVDRVSEAVLLSRFEAARPRLLGALLDAVSAAQRNLPNVNLTRLPRMADFAVWATAAEPGLGLDQGVFMNAYTENRAAATALTIEAAAIGAPIMALMQGRDRWSGTATELLAELESRFADEPTRRRKDWPRTASAVSNRLRRLATNLRAAGIDVQFDRASARNRRRTIKLERMSNSPSVASGSSASPVDNPESPMSADGGGRSQKDSGRPSTGARPAKTATGAAKSGMADAADAADADSHTHSETDDSDAGVADLAIESDREGGWV